MKTCLYDGGVLNVKDLLRMGTNDDTIKNTLLKAFNSRFKNGWEAEQARHEATPVHESMATIGG